MVGMKSVGCAYACFNNRTTETPNVRSNVVPGWIPGGRDVISALRRGVRAAFL